MKNPQYLTIAITSLLVFSCQTKNPKPESAVEAEKVISMTAIPDKVSSPVDAKEANRYEFVESEILPHPEDENEFNHLYMGSLDGYDYISVRSNKYKIPSEQLELDSNFPLTEDSTKWVHMRIHFSQVVYK